jgi:replication initiation protein RepC
MARLQAQEAYTETHPVLPDGMQRSDVERLLRRTAPIVGLNDGQLVVLLSMIEETRPSDWINPEIEPVCFARQTNIAALAGKDERTVRRIEHELEHRFGYLIKDIGLNGQRCRYRQADGTEFRQGLVFTPLIEMIPDLLAIADRIEASRAGRTVVKQKISAAKRIVREQIILLQARFPVSETLQALTEVFLGWPTRFYASTPLEGLQEHLGEVLELVERITAFVQQRSTTEPQQEQPVRQADSMAHSSQDVREASTDHCGYIDVNNPSLSDTPDIHDRPYIQDTNQENFVICNTHVDKRPDCKQSDDRHILTSPNGSVNCLDKKHLDADGARKSLFLENLNPRKLFHLGTGDMQDNVALYQGDAPYPSEMNFILAAIDRAHSLGISKHAYDLATDQMGDFAAALCILIIDRNVSHPVTPIKSPGGVLRAMTARHAKGQLYIERSLIGLSARQD